MKLFARKAEDNPEIYEAILDRSRARFPDTTLPDVVNLKKREKNFDRLYENAVAKRFTSTDEMKFLVFGRTDESNTLERQFSVSGETDKKIKKEKRISFDQLYANAVEKRFVSASEMKFLILVDKFLVRRRRTKLQGERKKFDVSGFTYVHYRIDCSIVCTVFEILDYRSWRITIKKLATQIPTSSIPKSAKRSSIGLNQSSRIILYLDIASWPEE